MEHALHGGVERERRVCQHRSPEDGVLSRQLLLALDAARLNGALTSSFSFFFAAFNALVSSRTASRTLNDA